MKTKICPVCHRRIRTVPFGRGDDGKPSQTRFCYVYHDYNGRTSSSTCWASNHYTKWVKEELQRKEDDEKTNT